MSTILAIDTSADLASAALLHAGRMISREASGVQNHSQTVLPMVQELLRDAGIAVGECDAIAFGAGPGSFTGVRTACGVAQGLAFGCDLPVIPVLTLHAMAQSCRERHGTDNVLVMLDARMEEVYWAQYRYSDGWQTISEPALAAASTVVPKGDAVACGNGLRAYASSIQAAIATRTAYPDIVPHAMQVASLAQVELAAGRAINAREAQPVYLRNKVAMTTAERSAKVSQ